MDGKRLIRHFRALALGVLAAAVGLPGLSGCGRWGEGGGGSASTVTAPMAVSPQAVWMVRGMPCAVPLSAQQVQPGDRSVTLTSPDGRTLDAPVWWLARAPSDGRAEPSGWLGPVRSLTVSRAVQVEEQEGAVGPWVVIPASMTTGVATTSGRWVIGGVVVRVQQVEPVDGTVAGPGSGETAEDAGVLAPALASPFAAWRARLASGGLRHETGEFDGGAGLLMVIEQGEAALWRTALARLTSSDPAVADQVVRRLAGLVRLDSDRLLPVWPASARSLSQLRADLLSEDLSEAQRTARARAWVDAQPRFAAWVCDDAGLRDAATGAVICSFMFINMTGQPVTVSAVVDEGGAESGPELALVEPWRGAKLAVSAPRAGAEQERAVVVRADGWVKRLPVVGREVEVRPPGLKVGPLVMDMTNELMPGACEAGQSLQPAALTPPADRATAGLLYAEPSRALRDAAGGDGLEWVLYLECLWPSGEAASSDRVRVLLGPTLGGPGAREIVVDLTEGARAGDGVRVVSRADRRVCWVRIPGGAVERDGRLRIGVVREVKLSGGGTFRTAWPRPLLPDGLGQAADPGRLCLDLGAWLPIGARGSGRIGRGEAEPPP